jgi:hypothetical protein
MWDIIIFVCIIIPSIHFIYFFLRIIIAKNKICRKPLKTLNNFERKCQDECFKKVKEFIDTHLKTENILSDIKSEENEQSNPASTSTT